MSIFKVINYFNQYMDNHITELLLSIPIILITLTLHEVAHGYIAYKIGDSTAKSFGRLSLNPLKHIDPIGALCMLFFHFGWAKPVPINSRNFKNPKRGMALSALAGPASNFIMAFISLFILSVFEALLYKIPVEHELPDIICKILAALLAVCFISVRMNISLGVFNMIPIPPLDGSRVLYSFLPTKYYFGIMKYEIYVSFALMALLYIGVLDAPLTFLVDKVYQGMFFIINLIPFI